MYLKLCTEQDLIAGWQHRGCVFLAVQQTYSACPPACRRPTCNDLCNHECTYRLHLLQELELRVTPLHAEYWGCLLMLAEHELEACRLLQEAEQQGVRLQHQSGVRPVGAPLPSSAAVGGVHTAVQKQVELLLSGG